MVRRSLFSGGGVPGCFDLVAGGGAYEEAGSGFETSGCRDRWGSLQYWDRLSGAYGMFHMGSRETADDRAFDGLDRVSGESFCEPRKGAGSPGFIRGDPAERSGDSAGAVFSNRMEKPDVYGIFLCGSPFFCGVSCKKADDRENTVSGPAVLKREVERVYGDGGFWKPSRGTCDGKACQYYYGGGCKRVIRRTGGRHYDPIPGCRNKKWNAAGSSL